jgi:hypothetical protein
VVSTCLLPVGGAVFAVADLRVCPIDDSQGETLILAVVVEAPEGENL